MFLLANISAIISQQIVYVPLLLMKLLSSIKTIVPIVFNSNTSLRIQTVRGGMKSSKLRRGMKSFRRGKFQNEQMEECIKKGWKSLL